MRREIQIKNVSSLQMLGTTHWCSIIWSLNGFFPQCLKSRCCSWRETDPLRHLSYPENKITRKQFCFWRMLFPAAQWAKDNARQAVQLQVPSEMCLQAPCVKWAGQLCPAEKDCASSQSPKSWCTGRTAQAWPCSG